VIKLANFTRHDQSEHINAFKLLEYIIDPTPRAPTANFKKMSEERLSREMGERLNEIKRQGFDGILIGGLTNCMIYAWYAAQKLNLKVLTCSFKESPGRIRKTLKAVREMLTAQEVSRWDGQAKPKVPGQKERLPNSSTVNGFPSPARPVASSPVM